MSLVSCIHPTCAALMGRGRSLCGRHFAGLSDDLRRLLLAASTKERVGEIHEEIVEYYKERIIGDNEVSVCRYCKGDIVWIDGRYGQLPIDVEGIEDDDTAFDSQRHKKHNCREYREHQNDKAVSGW